MEVNNSLSNLFFPRPLVAIVFLFLFVCYGDMAVKAETLWRGSLTEDVYGPPADFVWPYLADFCNIVRIIPQAMSFCVSGVPGQVGQQRYVLANLAFPSNVNLTYVRWEKHNLTALDPVKRSLTYAIMENNLGVKTSMSTWTIIPKDYGLQLKWDYVVSPFGTFQPGQVRGMLQSLLERTARKIENLLINIE